MIENEIWMSRLNGMRALFGQAKAFAVGRVFGHQGSRAERRFGGQAAWANTRENGIDHKTKPPVILVPIDFSDSSAEAADFGMSVARRARGQLLLIHAVHLNLDPYGPARVARLKAEMCSDALASSENIMVRAQKAGVSAVCAVEEGDPASVIARAARRWEVDLIVLAERERNRFARWFRRSITERVIQQVKCPVFVLRKDATAEVL